MTDRSRPHLRLIALAAVFAMLAASCGLSRDEDQVAAEANAEALAATTTLAPLPADLTAATVTFADGDSVEISADELNEFYDTLVADSTFVLGAFGEAGAPPGLRTSILSDIIIGAVIDDLLDQNDAEPSEQDLADGVDGLSATLIGFFPDEEDPFEATNERFETMPYLPFLAELQAKQLALGEALAGLEDEPETVEIPCSSHILLNTEEEAEEVIALLEDGGDFAELAMEFSTGPSGPTGGVLGCTDPNGFVVEFRDAIVGAPLDTIIGPVQTDFGFHVITVTDIEEQAAAPVDPQSLVGAELLSAISQVEVDVDDSIGEWDASAGAVIPAS